MKALYQLDARCESPRAMLWGRAIGNIQMMDMALACGADINSQGFLDVYLKKPHATPTIWVRYFFADRDPDGPGLAPTLDCPAHIQYGDFEFPQWFPLHLAICQDNFDAVRQLVSCTARLDRCHTKWDEGTAVDMLALTAAAYWGHPGIVRFLLNRSNANVNEMSWLHTTPLYWAAARRVEANRETLQILTERGGITTNLTQLPLFEGLSLSSSVQKVNAFCDDGPTFKVVHHETGFDVHYTVDFYKYLVRLVQLLVKLSDRDIANELIGTTGHTRPLLSAATEYIFVDSNPGDPECPLRSTMARTLLDLGTDINAREPDGKTALHGALY
ncbi:ankyrin repeat-containing domain protein [Podospora didyma]|uniref:Ankyrin repeat-containing domain protein n=1 Tax=Podospora didyma TaxID=330526 RepID=A0AAE0K6K8_9PEZI|nr:ankyrin repeat-containing domain protein [Podospora didyma]